MIDARTQRQIKFSLDRTLLFVFSELGALYERNDDRDHASYLQGLIRYDIEALLEAVKKDAC